jgi:hypothetical protein
LIAQHAEQLPESLELLVQKGTNGFNRYVSLGKAGSARQEHRVDIRFVDGAKHFRPDHFEVIVYDPLADDLVTCAAQSVDGEIG